VLPFVCYDAFYPRNNGTISWIRRHALYTSFIWRWQNTKTRRCSMTLVSSCSWRWGRS